MFFIFGGALASIKVWYTLSQNDLQTKLKVFNYMNSMKNGNEYSTYKETADDSYSDSNINNNSNSIIESDKSNLDKRQQM